MSDHLPVLWLCGPSGVGKSTLGWELFTGLPGASYLDIDQIGMCYPRSRRTPVAPCSRPASSAGW